MLRKHLTLTLAVMLVLLTAGCGKNAADPNAPPTANNTTPKGSTSGSTSTGTPAGSGTNTSTGSATSSPAGQSNKPAAAEKVTLGPLKIGDAAKVGPFEVTLTEKATLTKAAGLPAGYSYILLKFSVKNGSGGDYTINTTDHFKMDGPDGKAGRYNVSASNQKSPRLAGTASAGSTKDGWAGYLIKTQDGTHKLTYTHPDYGQATWEFTP